ncbi:MAG: TIGR03915 family putative DNA repair protein [Peptococcaceae bacterium]|nr:TIGR03915 family putative DNA repair protein [Peptococcaceae bacterium]
MDYLYDGSFDGLLTAIYHDYYSGRAGGIYPQDSPYQGSLFQEGSHLIETQSSLADRVYQAIEIKLSDAALPAIYHTYLSNIPEKETLILHYLRFSFSVGPRADSYHTHPAIQPVQKAARRVSFEKQRLLGLLRFIEIKQEPQPLLYARLTPDHNILPLLAAHFADRLQEENFIIHDCRRRFAVIHPARSPWRLQLLDNQVTRWLERAENAITDDPLTGNPQEVWYQNLWSRYFDSVAIESRRNARLQNHFIPYRYRCNLVEMIKLEQKTI